MRDLFSPDDTCPESTRYVTLVGGKLHVSASHTDAGCTSTWGIKYDPTTTVDPIITLSESDSCTGKVSFRSKVPPGDAIYDDAQALRPSRPHNLHCTQPSPPHATTSPHATTATRKRLHPSLAFPAAPHTARRARSLGSRATVCAGGRARLHADPGLRVRPEGDHVERPIRRPRRLAGRRLCPAQPVR